MSDDPTVTATGSRARRRFRELYGAGPWHLLSLLGSFVVTGYTVSRLLDETSALVQIAIWFLGAAAVWDLVLGPALALADRGVRTLHPLGVRGVSPLNYVRFPSLLAVLLLLVFAPSIFQRSERSYRLNSGLSQDPYLDRWAAVTATLFALSALAYAVAVLRAGRSQRD